MDLHEDMVGVSADDLERTHMTEVDAQDRYGVKFLRYWFNEPSGTLFCLIEAPDADACHAVHRDVSKCTPSKIIPVEPGTVDLFLGGGRETAVGGALTTEGTLDTALRAVLFTDIAGSTAMTERLGDDGALELLRVHDTIVRAALAATAGREVKHTGDGIMAAHASVTRAVECAIAIQRGVISHRTTHPEAAIQVRVGVSAGEPVAQNDDLFGAAVQLARRVCDHAKPDEILVANVVRDLTRGKSFAFESLGDIPLKGFAEPVHLYKLAW